MKRLIFVCLMGMMAALMQSAAQAGVKIQHWTLASGARVYFVESHDLPIVDIQVDFPAGSAYDVREKAGVAGFTRSLLDAGVGSGDSALDEEKIAGRLVDIGARLSGSGDMDRASVSLRTLSSKRERDASIELLRLVMQQPSFPAEVVEREKTRTISGIREADTRPDSVAAKGFSKAVYGNHPYGLQTTVETVEKITRDDLVAFHRARFGANGAVISVIGDLSRAEVEAIANQLTDGLPQTKVDASLPQVQFPVRGTTKIAHPASQAHIFLGLPSVRRGDPDYFPLLVGNYVLGGGGFVSRLVHEVREKKGYAYSVYSYFQPARQLGVFQIGLQTKREQANEALKLTEDTLTEFLKKGPTEKEVKAAKRNLADGFGLRLDSNRKILEYLSVIGFFELPLTYLDDFPRKIEAVTAAEIRAAFQRKVKPENIVTVIVAGD